MESFTKTYCRFCAELKTPDKLINIQSDSEKQAEIQLKLSFLNACYVDVLSDDMLPKTLCFVCYDSLNKAYNFLKGVKCAQEVLNNLLIAETKCDLSEEDEKGSSFDAFFDNEDAEVKTEASLDGNLETIPGNTPIEVKQEPKDEKYESFEQTLNVKDILDAAMCDVSFTSNVTIYAKEVNDVPVKKEKSVKSWKDYSWICVHCNIEFLNMETLRSHSKTVHGKCAAHFCIDCKTAIKEDFNCFVNHIRKHKKTLRSRCQYCDEHITQDLPTHIMQHFVKSQRPCPMCGEILRNDELLKMHVRNYSSAKPKRKPRRKPGTPITIQDLTCDLCKKVYKNPNSLRDHMKLHIIDRTRNYTCDRCGKTFFNKGTLTSHIMSHDKIRPHVCRICNRSFLFPNMLRRHVEMHSGIKPFSCEQCGRCFRLQYQLNAHKIIHTDSMPYVCQYCNKAFRFKQILKNHERQHTGAKPYSCQHCGMEFTNWSNYNKHMKRRHGTDTSKKKITPDGVFPINPETGQIVQVQDLPGAEEWKTKIMIPGKRGKKKAVKTENV